MKRWSVAYFLQPETMLKMGKKKNYSYFLKISHSMSLSKLEYEQTQDLGHCRRAKTFLWWHSLMLNMHASRCSILRWFLPYSRNLPIAQGIEQRKNSKHPVLILLLYRWVQTVLLKKCSIVTQKTYLGFIKNPTLVKNRYYTDWLFSLSWYSRNLGQLGQFDLLYLVGH